MKQTTQLKAGGLLSQARALPKRAHRKAGYSARNAWRRLRRHDVVNRGGRGVVNVIDVGSVGGLPSEWRDRAYLVKHLLNFEPLDEPRTRGTVLTIPAALWSTSETREFYISRAINGTGDSLLKQNYAYVRAHFDELRHVGPKHLAETWFERSQLERTISVRTTSLDDVLETLDIRYDFLKIDAQGADLAILKGGDRFVREDCLGMQLEAFTIPLLEDVPLLPALDEYLGARGFARVYTAPPHGTFDSQHDVVFLRRDACPCPALDAICNVYGLPGS